MSHAINEAQAKLRARKEQLKTKKQELTFKENKSRTQKGSRGLQNIRKKNKN